MKAAVTVICSMLLAAGCWDGGEAAPPRLEARSSVLAVVRGELMRVDPSTLRPLPGKRVQLGGHGLTFAFSPDRSKLVAVGPRTLRIIDLRRMEVLADVPKPPGRTRSLSWPTPRRIIAGLSLIDPVGGRVLVHHRFALAPWLVEWQSTTGEAVALFVPQGWVEPARLVVFDVSGRLRSVRLSRIRAGYGVGRDFDPGFALDPERRRAFVIGAGEVVAEIDLRSLSVHYHPLREDKSLLTRFRDWIEPVADAKSSPWTQRGALWLGNDALAIFGHDTVPYLDGAGSLHERDEPFGLRLVDTREWTFRTVDDSARWVEKTRGMLLAYALLWDSRAQEDRGIGLRSYSLDGEERFHLFDDEPIHGLQIVGPYARAILETSNTIAVIDLRSGEVVRERDVVPDEPFVRVLEPSS